jgi:hypothetical protein
VREGIECDDEALFAATLLHDYAFGQIEQIENRCFTLVGAEVAAGVLASSPLAPSVQRDGTVQRRVRAGAEDRRVAGA